MWYTRHYAANHPCIRRIFVKPATILAAFLVAALLFVPAPVRAASLRTMDQSEQPSTFEQDATQTATPTEEAEDDSGIVNLHATASRLRGRIELGWSVNDEEHSGNFVVERSINGGSWRPIKVCSVRFDSDQTDYDCTDRQLISGATYAYRVCLTTKGFTCSSVTPSQPVTVKAP